MPATELNAVPLDDFHNSRAAGAVTVARLVEVVRSRRQPETSVHFCSDRIVSSDLASSRRVGVRAIGELRDRRCSALETCVRCRAGTRGDHDARLHVSRKRQGGSAVSDGAA